MSRFIAHILFGTLLLLTTSLTGNAEAEVPTKRPSDMERGQTLWERHCWQCHGATNAGDGPATTDLVAAVPPLIGELKVNEATARLILRGKGSMPGFEQSFDLQDARRVLMYQVSLTAAGPKPAEDNPDATNEAAPAAAPDAAPSDGDE